jgi:hypothetical protein
MYISDSDIVNWPSGTTDAEKQAAIETSEAIVEAALRRHYRPKPFDVTVNGNGQDRIFLPLTTGILTVTEVRISGVVLDSSDYSFDSNSIFVNEGSGSTIAFHLIDDLSVGGLFPRGFANIRVKGTAGSATIPAWIREVCRIVCSDHNDPTLYTHYMASESIGGYSYSLSPTLAGQVGMTGLKEADDIIALFRRKKGILMAP